MIEELIRLLDDVGMRATDREIADALWLARFLPTGSFEAVEVIEHKPLEERPVPPDPAGRLDRTPPAISSHIGEARFESEKKVEFYPMGSRTLVSSDLPARQLRAPTSPAIVEPLKLCQALRPLMRKYVSTRNLAMDEVATANQIASGGPVSPVMRSEGERWFEVAVVFDDSASMFIWRELYEEFYHVLECLGAFSNIQKWKLTEQERVIVLMDELGGIHDLRKLNDPSGRRLIIIVTDGVSGRWAESDFPRAVAVWACQTPVVIAQVLPRRLWSRTLLGGVTAEVWSLRAGRANQEFSIKQSWAGQYDRFVRCVPIVPVEIEAEPLARWAESFMGSGSRVSAILLEPELEDADLVGDEDVMVRDVELSAEIRVDRFQRIVSSNAFELAVVLSAFPLTLPVMRLVQTALVSGSTQSHLAEVFLGGILERVTPDPGSRLRDEVEFDFHLGVRELLQRHMSRSEAIDILASISSYVEERFGQRIDFSALASDESGDARIGPDALPFAQCGAQLVMKFHGLIDRESGSSAGVSNENLRANANSSVSDDKISGNDADGTSVLSAIHEDFVGGCAEIRRRFLASPQSADACVREKSDLVDALVRSIADMAVQDNRAANPGHATDQLAVVAVGDYGRGMLAPYSLIDLLFVLPYGQRINREQLIEVMIDRLWDLGLRLSYAVRTVDECIRTARQDMAVCTALIDGRHVWGNQDLADDLGRRFLRDVVRGTGLDFIESKLRERDQRHERWGTSQYVLEPNIEEGKGGLGDLHTLRWIGQYLYSVADVSGLADRGVLTRDEARRFERAESHLWTVRCHLHYLAGRAEERLTFDLQKPIAVLTGYVDRKGSLGVERFMRHYFLTTKEVGDLTRIVCAALEAESQPPRRRSFRLFGQSAAIVDGFAIEGERLNVRHDDQFVETPIDMIRLFRVAQTRDLDLHPHALKLITRSQGAIRRLRTDPDANRLFIEILTAVQDPEIALRRMSGAGVLGQFLDDFGRVIGQMQYDMYHVYTVDEHTLHAIGVVHRIETGQLADQLPMATRVMARIQSRRALYVAMFLHDIAKGRGGDHSEIGARIAQRLGPRLGLDDEETETAAWLVREHLLMSRVALNRDIEDEKTITDFVQRVVQRERLRLLLVLTTADIYAVGPGRWNAWKGSLLGHLYRRALDVMSGGLEADGQSVRVAAAQDAVRPLLPDWAEPELAAFFAKGYPSYWLSLDADTHAYHARLLREMEAVGQPLTVDTRIDRGRAVTEVTIMTNDHPGLFATLCGALAVAGATIVDAKIYTLVNGVALEVFTVQDAAQGTVFEALDKLARMSAVVERALSGEIDLAGELARRKPIHPPRAYAFRFAPRVIVENDESSTHTLIEIDGRDRPGLLHDVARALTNEGVQISSVKTAVLGIRVVVVIYAKDVFGLKITHAAKLAQIRTSILEALAEVDSDAGL